MFPVLLDGGVIALAVPHQLQLGGTCSTTTPNEGDEGVLNHLPLLVGLSLEALSFPAEVVNSLMVAKCMEQMSHGKGGITPVISVTPVVSAGAGSLVYLQASSQANLSQWLLPPVDNKSVISDLRGDLSAVPLYPRYGGTASHVEKPLACRCCCW